MASIFMINIGSELLNGLITNTNATKVGDLLQQGGYALNGVLMIPDQPERIREAVEDAWTAHDVVLVSGGLGPTKDDMTKHVLADWWGSELVEHAPTLEFLLARYAERGRTMNDLTRAQALVPAGAEVLHNPVGTAPGLGFSRTGKWLVAMPGVPFEMLTMIEGHVLPRLRQLHPSRRLLHAIIRMSNVSESEIAIRIEDLESGLPPHFSLAYLPRTDGLWLDLKAQAAPSEEAAVAEELAQWQAKFVERLPRVYANNDAALPGLLGQALLATGGTLAVAESLTGGALAARVVSESGASRYFVGSVTAYSPAAKTALLDVPAALIEEKGVVSADVAMAMAAGVREKFGSTFALSTTGWAEAPKDDPNKAGAWIGFSGPNGSEAMWLTHYYRRLVNIERTVEQALVFGLEKIRRGMDS